jgi:hypothetical protein
MRQNEVEGGDYKEKKCKMNTVKKHLDIKVKAEAKVDV